ncbi:HNH endonuclease [Flavobacterium sp. MR2016-29]|uniref:HNH endonuclease n=1 Tax=Flavobacterium sp. MR2016-29 TaxID=2783795 RepID=UPI00188B8626|nr:HNH endonuclease signature motif containing protein [Flavobacterium sp. MR2016-29]MBF4491892.1 HNH endonuclease [Flavobacterium sp. MR2016-29]
MFDPTNSRYRFNEMKSKKIYRRYKQEDKSINLNILEPITIEIPSHGSYGSLLFTTEWKNKRIQILDRDQKCLICFSIENLQVHHRQYHFIVRENKFKLPWEYDEYLLITLCESCHRRGHSKYKVPTINI